MKPKNYSLTEARTKLTRMVRDAQAGNISLVTRRGIPVFVVVPVEQWQAQNRCITPNAGILSRRGTGRGLWGLDSGKAVVSLRDEW